MIVGGGLISKEDIKTSMGSILFEQSFSLALRSEEYTGKMGATKIQFVLLATVTLFLIHQIAEGCKPSNVESKVCASNGITYKNSGYFHCLTQWPKENSSVRIVHNGTCGSGPSG